MTTDDFLYGLLDYGALPADARRALAAHAEAHPPLLSLHEEVRALGSDAPADVYADVLLAQYAATRSLPYPAPEPLRSLYARLEAILAEDPRLARRLEVLERRLAVAGAEHDAEAQFTALTERFDAGLSEAKGERTPRPARRTARQFVRGAGALALGALVVYGALAVLSVALRSDLDRLAALPEDVQRAEPISLRPRSADVPASADILYLEALQHARDAWRRPVGLFPHYEETALREAVRDLEAAVDAAPLATDPFVRHESLFLLARLRIAEGDLDGARAALRQLQDEDAERAADAAELLRAIDAAT